MRILMLGWEFPPYMAGGLGTACFGLTRALNKAGHRVTFVMPRAVGRGGAEFVDLMGPDALRSMLADLLPEPGVPAAPAAQPAPPAPPAQTEIIETIREIISRRVEADVDTEKTTVLPAPAAFESPYTEQIAVEATREAIQLRELMTVLRERGVELRTVGAGEPVPEGASGLQPAGEPAVPAAAADELSGVLDAADHLCRADEQYGSDLFADAERYARVVAAMASNLDFDVIHAHDWLAYPAGIALRAVTGKPLVCHTHATEFDRSGQHINQPVYDIERAGVHAADRVIAVSKLTREILIHRYHVDPGKVDVVYNGIEGEEAQPAAGGKIESDDKIVLFLGRITHQKGPEYFIRAAARVLEKFDKVKFVVAGSGDMAVRMIDEAARLGCGDKVLFTGFLRGRDVERVYQMADCYVMPSVSEPFGIVALEAIKHGTPCIISRQSGVSEVLSHALKVDFWDVNDIADKVLAVLRYPPLSQTLTQHGPIELRRLTWTDAARRTVATYGRAITAHANAG